MFPPKFYLLLEDPDSDTYNVTHATPDTSDPDPVVGQLRKSLISLVQGGHMAGLNRNVYIVSIYFNYLEM